MFSRCRQGTRLATLPTLFRLELAALRKSCGQIRQIMVRCYYSVGLALVLRCAATDRALLVTQLLRLHVRIVVAFVSLQRCVVDCALNA